MGSLFLTGCNNQGYIPPDTPTSGTIKISVDESYKPLMDSEIKVFQVQHPKAHIIPVYESEGDCFRNLINDSSRVIIVTRDLNKQEQGYFKGIRMPMVSKILAWDAVALIVNPQNPDTDMTLDQVHSIMDGTTPDKWQVVFDEQNSSTARFMVDSINHGKPLPSYALAAHGSKQVVDYVARNRKALGVIGVSWISDPNDSLSLAFLNQVKVVGVKGPGEDRFFKPYQYYIALRSYPLTRAFYFILREAYMGLGTGFVNFLSRDKGQMIMAKYRLFPAHLDIVFRNATIN